MGRDELPAAMRVEAKIEDALGLRGSAGLFQQLLYYPPGADGYVAHTDCRFDAAGAALGWEGDAHLHQRPFTTLLYLNDLPEGGETRFPKLKRAAIAPRPGRLLAWRNVDEATESYCDEASTHAAAGVPRGSPVGKMVLQRWYEFEPLLPPPNAHGEPWTRCSLDLDGAVETCRTYGASTRARYAANALNYGLAAFADFKHGARNKAKDAVASLRAALDYQPGLAMAHIVLAHLLFENSPDNATQICAHLGAYLAQYPDVPSVSDEALSFVDELGCER